LSECARFGTAAAGLVIQGLGSDAGIVDFDHTLQFMRSAEALPISDDE
jgi:sugar/nucleoside kinase (ribokinase family)